MNEQLETPFVPDARIPKTLLEQAAEAFALNLVVVSLPIIKTLCFQKLSGPTPDDFKETTEDGKEQELKNELMLARLRALKRWYWVDKAELFGECDSKTRCTISASLLEVIDMNEKLRPCEPLHKFALQLLFACEAGNVGGLQPIDIDTPVTRQFSSFLISVAPFYIRELRDHSLRFSEPLPINLVLVNSADLRRIQLYRNICSSSLDRLRINCLKAEVITLDYENLNHARLVIDDNLFKTFFGNKGRDFAFQLIDNGSSVPQSFPNLKEVCIRGDHILVSLNSFVQCLQYSYNNVKLIVSCLTAVPYDRMGLRYPFVCPTFQVVGRDDGKKITCVYFCDEDLEINETTGPSPNRIVDADIFLRTYRTFFSHSYYMQEILTMMQVCNLRYIFSEDMKIDVSPRMTLNADKLRVLYIFGPIPDGDADEGLAEALNQCPDLKVLGFTIKPMVTPVLSGLKPLNNLKVLSVCFSSLRPCSAVADARFPHCLDTPLKGDESEEFLELLILAAPNLEVLEAPCLDVIAMLINSGFLQKIHTLSVTIGRLDNITHCAMKMPRLKVLLLGKFVDYRFFLALKQCFHYSRLNISYKKGRLVLPHLP